MADLEMEKSYSGFERFMFFVTPILFTLVLLGVLLTLFNINLRNKVLEAGHSIPVVGKLLPDAPAAAQDPAAADATMRSANDAAKITQLQAQLNAKANELAKAVDAGKQDDRTIEELKAQLAQVKATGEKKALSDQEYQAHIAELASMFAQMTPSKAAPILESLSSEEMVLILNAMQPSNRVMVMQKMTTSKAADATMMMKDIVPAKDQQIAALQARIKKLESTPAETTAFLNQTQLAATFSSMTPANAADVLLKLADVNPSKTLAALRAVNDASRSKILDAMSAANKDITAQLVAKLMVGK